MERRTLTTEQRERVLQVTEGHFCEVKGRTIAPARLSRSVSAFANADGGELYVGLSERTSGGFTWNGFDDPEDANAHIQVFDSLFPLGGEYAAVFLEGSSVSNLILQVTIRKSRNIIRASDGIAYVRRGAQNLPYDTPERLRILERAKGISSFETETVNVPLSEISNSETVLRFMLDVIPTAEPEPWLQKQQLVTEGKPTVAGVVLFSDLPQAALPKRCGAKIYRYKTSEDEGTRDTMVGVPESVEGCAYDLIKAAVDRTTELVSQIQVLGPDGLEQVHYPPETLHEVITNAVLHRDYSVADDVHIRIFDNRVEVESAGRLPAHVTVSNILTERFARNGNLVRIINKFPNAPNRDVGEGLNTAFAAMRKLKLRDPLIKELENALLVIIKHEKLASAEETVMEWLRKNTTITNAKGRDLTGIPSENAMKSVFYRLRDRGILEQVPGLHGSKSAWRLTAKGRRQGAK